MPRASRTIQQPLGYQPAHAAWFAATQDLFNQVAAFYFAVIATHPGVLDLDAKAALTALEQLTHSTKDNPHPAMPLSTIATTIPATFRRAAIHAALGAARSFSTHLEQWRRRKAKARAKGKHFTQRPPVPPCTWNRAVTLYAGMWKDRQGATIMLKLWTGHTWCWLKCRLSGRAIPDGWEVGSPALVQHGTRWWMHTSIAKQLKHPGTVEQQITTNPGTRICAIDLNMDSSLAVCTVQTSEGTVLATRFIGGGEEIHGFRKCWLGRIARRRRDTGIIAAGQQDNAQLWAKVRHLDEQTAHRVSRRIVEFAAAHGATVLVFEHLGNLTPDKGKYSRRANAKRMYWLKGRIFHYTKYKAWQIGMVTSRVNPRNTSRACARCGALVARYHAGHPTEGYTPGAPLVCCARCGMKGQADRNASLVIGQRLITRYQKQREEKPHTPRRERPAKAGGVAGSQDAEGEEQPSTDLARYGAGNGFGTTQGELHGMASGSSVSLGHYGAQESSGHAAQTLNADYPGVQEEAARFSRRRSVTDQFDIVVAGGGHNSLVTAAYLAKAGYSCLILEARHVIGGNTMTEELTLPGFLHDTCSTAHAIFMESPIWRNQELPLAEYGLEYIQVDPASHVVFPDGTYITQWIDIDRTCEEISRFSRKDAATYRKMISEWRSVAPIFNKLRYTPAGWDPSIYNELVSHPQGAIWMRRQALSAWDIIDTAFEDWHVKSWMVWFAEGTLQPSDRPGTGLLAYSFVAGRQRSGWAIPKGGSRSLPNALSRIIEDHGGTILTNKPVSRLILEEGRCVGVETETGEQFRARHAVVSTIHVKHLVNMAPPEAWGDAFLYGVETYKAGRTMFVTHYATTEPPRFAVDGGTLSVVAAGVAQTAERQLRVTEDFNHGIVASDQPVLLVLTPSVEDSSRVPEGKHIVKVINFQPYSLRGGPEKWDEIKERVAANNLEQLRQYASNLTNDKILATEIRSPLDLERYNRHNWHGSCHGGDLSPSQSETLRPVPGYAQHRMPIPGLYQTGATTHPGGSVTGAPGRNAAMVLLKDLGRDLNEVIQASIEM